MENNLITDMIPHRHPFIMIDKIILLELQNRAVAIKNVSLTDPQIQGHFPHQPIMPNSLILEAMNQTASAIFFKDPEFSGQIPYYSAINASHFKKIVKPGDQLRIEVDVKSKKGNAIVVTANAFVDGKMVAESELVYSFAPKPSRPQIHPTASVHPSANLGKDVVVGPYSIIGENVVIGDRTVLHANVLIEANTEIGEDTQIYFGAVIGSIAQDVKFKGEQSRVIIGDRNHIREFVTINRATGEGESTVVGSDNMFMTGSHVGHNCVLGNNIVMVNNSSAGGHSVIEDFATIGGHAGIHQFVRIGSRVMVGAYATVLQDTPPFMLCEGTPSVVRNINAVGVKRAGFSKEAIKEIKFIFRELYRSDHNYTQAREAIAKEKVNSNEAKQILAFCDAESIRGLSLKNKHND